ncbi:MAG: ClpXP protease specificity-enhancing factor SspB [Proteobacteria bacterium]|nr:ClpXP protease specificity-enhancing factor SspB [Cystobacterineae bacterium]MCL2314712.1 ClpXP protease specificity-enhancing factor SspB [Pseudomonadota bacterium]
MENSLQDKQSKLESMLEKGMVMVHLDARKPGVRLPAHLKNQIHLTLNLSHRFSPADLTVNVWGVRATLSFEGRPFPVAIPWSAIFAIRSHITMEFWLFPEDVPEEFLEAEKVAEPLPVKVDKRATFQLVHSVPQEAGGEEAAAEEKEKEKEEEEGTPEPSDKPKRPSHLKLLH